MKKKLTSRLKRYYKQIDSYIPKKYPHRQEIISSIHQDISSYVSEHPDAGYEDILEHFGTPEEMTLSFAESLSSEDIVSTTQQHQKKHRMVLAFTIISLFIVIGAGIFFYWAVATTPLEIDETTIIYSEVNFEETSLTQE